MWCGIIAATVFLKRHGASWRSLGLTLTVGLREWAVTLGLASTSARPVKKELKRITNDLNLIAGGCARQGSKTVGMWESL